MSYNQRETSTPLSESIQRQEFDNRVKKEKNILDNKVRPIFKKLINDDVVRWDDHTQAIIGVSINNFNNLPNPKNDLVYISLFFDKKTRPVGINNKLANTCSEIRIAIQDNTLKLVTDRGSADFGFFPIDEDQIESTINLSINHPPIIKTISSDIKD